MRFQPGIGYTGLRRPRGRGRGDPPYRMSQSAYQARLRNLVGWRRPRTYAETRRIELEIALGTFGHESYRQVARRLGLRSHAYCWRVARRYRAGQIPLLPPNEESLLSMRESLGLGDKAADTALAQPARANIGGERETAIAGIGFLPEPCMMTTDESLAERWREAREEQRKKPVRPRHVLFSVPVR